MKTYVLTWNPAKWTFRDWPDALRDVAENGFCDMRWSCVNSHAAPGDAVLLKKTGKGLTGIIASGVVLSAPYKDRHWSKGMESESKQYIRVRFDRLADYMKGEVMRVNDKRDIGFVPQASGCELKEAKASGLMKRFHDYAVAPTTSLKPDGTRLQRGRR